MSNSQTSNEDTNEKGVFGYDITLDDLEKEILHKIYKNSKREYKVIDGVNMRVKEYEEE